jgi:1,4-dihydroxy-2-naphthoate octaprenyltransferase
MRRDVSNAVNSQDAFQAIRPFTYGGGLLAYIVGLGFVMQYFMRRDTTLAATSLVVFMLATAHAATNSEARSDR